MKAKLLDVAVDQNIEMSTVAFAYAYFEKIFVKVRQWHGPVGLLCFSLISLLPVSLEADCQSQPQNDCWRLLAAGQQD